MFPLFIALGLAACKSAEELADRDGDGEPAIGFRDGADCDDNDATVHPGATEQCGDGVDNNCDGAIDDDGAGAATWYADADEDGFGEATATRTACEQPEGFVGNDDDCNDAAGAIHPDATEACDGADTDCNGMIDDGVGSAWFPDGDGDGYGIEDGATLACAPPDGFVAVAGDCNDEDAGASPSNVETCDGVDNDCSGTADDGVGDTWHADSDGDGFGDPANSVVACASPAGHVANDTDCDDGNATANPAATEVCNGSDDNCDGATDEEVQLTWFHDGDGDGFGDSADGVEACAAPADHVASGDDCNDSDASVSPSATESCDDVDEDCNGIVDDGLGDPFARDEDGDGFADLSQAIIACSQPAGYVPPGQKDCDDTDPAVNPGAVDDCNDVDDDCDIDVDEDADWGSNDCPGVGCADLLDRDATLTDGFYSLVDNDGVYTAECDMTIQGGGWTYITSQLVASRSWSTIEIFGPWASEGEWTADVFEFRPVGEDTTGCASGAVRLTVQLPFEFTEWEGSWKAESTAPTGGPDDDDSTSSWGDTVTGMEVDCPGRLMFGTPDFISKRGGDWGTDWPESQFQQVWQVPQDSVPASDTMLWEHMDSHGNTDEAVELHEIRIRTR